MESLLEEAVKVVLKVTEARVPQDAFSADTRQFSFVYSQVQKKRFLKDCPPSDDLADAYVNEELNEIAKQVRNMCT